MAIAPPKRVPVEVRNSYCTFPRDTSPSLVKEMDEATAYPVEGAEHSPAFRRGWWDGKEHLIAVSKRTHQYTVPTGLLPDLLKVPGIAERLDLIDKRRRPGERRELPWVFHPPRGYQQEAVDAAVAERMDGWTSGRGLINVPIRGGKTLIAARIIQTLGHRALFIVPDDTLLYQTVAAFKQYMGEDAPIGICGDGRWEPDWITVSTFQTLIKSPKRAFPLLAAVDILFVDEAHHLKAPAWRQPILACDAWYKLGLSATIYLSKDRPNDTANIWFKAATGSIIHRITMKRLFDEGFLMRPDIAVYPMKSPPDCERMGWARAYDKLVVNNAARNSAIADLVEDAASRGLRSLVDTGRHDQMRAVHKMLAARGLKVEMVHGKTAPTVRMKLIQQLGSGDLSCLVGTVLGEGVDIPSLEVVINAEGLKSPVSVIQRMRNLTAAEGKSAPIFCDFIDLTHPKLKQHSAERLKMYKGIRGFRVRAGSVDERGRYRLPGR